MKKIISRMFVGLFFLVPVASFGGEDPKLDEVIKEKKSEKDDRSLFGDRFEISGKLRADYRVSKNDEDKWRDDLRLKGFEIKFTTKITEQLKAVIKTKFDRQFRKNGKDVDDDFDFENFIKEAYIKIDNINGVPVAFIIGKHEIAFGQDFTRMPIYHDTPIHGIAEQNEVIGFTVALTMEEIIQSVFLPDLIEGSIFETEKGDLEVGEFDGASIRLSKKLYEKFKLNASYMYKGNGHDDELDTEQRASVGLVFKNGAWVAWVEGLYFDNHRKFGDGIGISGGVARELGPGEVAMESTFIDDALIQIGIGYSLYITENLTFGPEIRYTWYDDEMNEDDGAQLGARLEYRFGAAVKRRKRYLFGPSDESKK